MGRWLNIAIFEEWREIMYKERWIDRRIGERRVLQIPIDFKDRRKGERRSGKDRRKKKE